MFEADVDGASDNGYFMWQRMSFERLVLWN